MNETLVAYLAELLGLGTAELSHALSEEGLAASEALAEQLQELQVYKGREWQELLAAERAQGHREGLREGTGNSYGAIDKYLERYTGEKKQAEERTLDYLQRLLEAAPSPQSHAEAQARLGQLEAALEASTEESQAKLKEQKKSWELEKALLQVPLSGPEKAQARQREYLAYLFQQNYSLEMEEGKAVVRAVEGKDPVNSATAEAAGLSEVLQGLAQEHLSLAAPVRKRGTGVQYASNSGGPSQEYGSLQELKASLTARGVVLASTEAQEAIADWLRNQK